MRDLMNNIHVVMARPPQAAVTDNTAMTFTSCDLRGYESATIVILHGTNADADATYTVAVEESDDNSSFTAVAAADLIGTTALAGFQFDDDNEPRKIGYRGGKRYIRASVTPANNTGNAFVAAAYILGHPRSRPTANPPV
jgi:hypothetical protein